MRKLLTLVIFSILFSPFVAAQTVDSVRIEQAGDMIKVHYKILNSTRYQTFRVTVFCSINGGLESKLKNISGDFGENVIGGRDDYMVLWDVLKDVDEVKSVDFSVRTELLKDDSPKDINSDLKLTDSQKYWSKERFYVLFTGAVGSGYILAGGRIGYMGRWGFSLSTVAGTKKFTEPNTDKPTYTSTLSALDITKKIANKDEMQLHLLAGIAFGDHEGSSGSVGGSQASMRWGFDLGLVAGIKRFALHAGFSSIKAPFFTEYDSDGTFCFDFGIGIRF